MKIVSPADRDPGRAVEGVLHGRTLPSGLRQFHPDNPYIARHDAPKVEHLREQFPEHLQEVGNGTRIG